MWSPVVQLLREFWAPFIGGVAWTVYNLVDRSMTSWSVRDFINTFGPTFFFLSWVLAQW